jgi:hypothetical protein
MNRALFVACLTLALSAGAAQVEPRWQWAWSPGDCPHGLHQAPQGPFAVMLYCEDALGTYLAVIRFESIGSPVTENGRWSLNNRYWHDATWGSDITGFKWINHGAELVVSTSPAYGSGGLFVLDLEARTFKQSKPKGAKASITEPGPGYTISGEKLEPFK